MIFMLINNEWFGNSEKLRLIFRYNWVQKNSKKGALVEWFKFEVIDMKVTNVV